MGSLKQLIQSLKPKDRISGAQLRRLLQEDSDSAWEVFLTDYTAVMLSAIQAGYKRMGIRADDDRIMDTYAYALEKLKADNYSGLKSYRGDSTLETFLTSVCRNACIDLLRRDAPPETPSSIRCLSEVHQLFFRLRYVERHELRECWGFLGNMGFLLSEREFEGIVNKVENNLTDGMRGRFTGWPNRQTVAIDESPTDDENERPPVVVPDKRTPEDDVVKPENKELFEQIIKAVEACKSSLLDQERMIIHLIYWKGKKPRDIASLMRLSAKEVSRKKGIALQKLKQCALQHLQQQGHTQQEIEEITNRLEHLYKEMDTDD